VGHNHPLREREPRVTAPGTTGNLFKMFARPDGQKDTWSAQDCQAHWQMI
jgi:hypothetical protein